MSAIHADAYSFAMAYNRYGWSAMAVLGLLLFEPPRHGSAADIIEMACAALLLAALFYLKMTYFAAGVTRRSRSPWSPAHMCASAGAAGAWSWRRRSR